MQNDIIVFINDLIPIKLLNHSYFFPLALLSDELFGKFKAPRNNKKTKKMIFFNTTLVCY